MITDNYKDYDPVDDCWHSPATDIPEQEEPVLAIYKEDSSKYSAQVISKIFSNKNGYIIMPKTKHEWEAANCYDRDGKYLCDWLDVAAWAYIDELAPSKLAKRLRHDYRDV